MPRVANFSAEKQDRDLLYTTSTTYNLETEPPEYEFTQASINTDIGISSYSQDEFDENHFPVSNRHVGQPQPCTDSTETIKYEERANGFEYDKENQKPNNKQIENKDFNTENKIDGDEKLSVQACLDVEEEERETRILKGIHTEDTEKQHNDRAGKFFSSTSETTRNDDLHAGEVIKNEDLEKAKTDFEIRDEEQVSHSDVSSVISENETIAPPNKKETNSQKYARIKNRMTDQGVANVASKTDELTEWNLSSNRPRRRNRSSERSVENKMTRIFGIIWPKLTKIGWTYTKGSKFNIAFHYLAPGVKKSSDGILGLTRFDNEQSLVKYIEDSYPEIYNEASRDLNVKVQPANKTKKNSPSRIKRKDSREKQRKRLSSSRNPRENTKYLKSKKRKATNDLDSISLYDFKWVQIYGYLKDIYGWSHKKGAGLIDWVYVRSSGSTLNEDYFYDTDGVYEYIGKNRGNYKALFAKLSLDASEACHETHKKRSKSNSNSTEIAKPSSQKHKLNASFTSQSLNYERKEKVGQKPSFQHVWSILKSKYNWRHKKGSKLVSWYYIKTDLNNGVLGQDYFTSADDVMEHVLSNKNQYTHIFSDFSQEAPSSPDPEKNNAIRPIELNSTTPRSPMIDSAKQLSAKSLLARVAKRKRETIFEGFLISFVGIDDLSGEESLMNIVKERGGKAILNVPWEQLQSYKKEKGVTKKEKLIFVTRPSCIETPEYLGVLASGVPCLHLQWLHACDRQNCLVDWVSLILVSPLLISYSSGLSNYLQDFV